MEAAREAAETGHEVILFEAAAALGGRLALAARTGGRDGWRPYIEWAASELRRLGVDLHLQTRATPDAVRAVRPNFVVLACGAVEQSPTLPHEGDVVTIEEFLARDERPGRVALADLGSAGPAFWTAALEATSRGARDVVVITPSLAAVTDLEASTAEWIRGELTRRRVHLLVSHRTISIAAHELVAANVYSNREVRVELDTAVVSTAREPAGGELWESLADLDVLRVGDALVPRDAVCAIREGQEAGAAMTSEGRSTSR
jgi:hypothetical protein